MSEAEVFEFLESLPDDQSMYDDCIQLAHEAYRRGDLYTMQEAYKMAWAVIRPPDHVRIVF